MQRLRRSTDVVLWLLAAAAIIVVLFVVVEVVISGGVDVLGDDAFTVVGFVLLAGVVAPIALGLKRIEGRRGARAPAVVAVVAGLAVVGFPVAAFILAPLAQVMPGDAEDALVVLAWILLAATGANLFTAIWLSAPRLPVPRSVGKLRLVAVTTAIVAAVMLVEWLTRTTGVSFLGFGGTRWELAFELSWRLSIPILCIAVLLVLGSVTLLRLVRPSIPHPITHSIATAFRCPHCVANRARGAQPAPLRQQSIHTASRCPSCSTAVRLEIEGFRCACGMNMAGVAGERCSACDAPLPTPWPGSKFTAGNVPDAPSAELPPLDPGAITPPGDRAMAWLALVLGLVATAAIAGHHLLRAIGRAGESSLSETILRFEDGGPLATDLGYAGMIWIAALVAASSWRRGWRRAAALLETMIVILLGCILWNWRFDSVPAFPSPLEDPETVAGACAAGAGTLALLRLRVRWPTTQLVRGAAVAALLAVLGLALPSSIVAAAVGVHWWAPATQSSDFFALAFPLIALVVLLRRLERRQMLRQTREPIAEGVVKLPCPRCACETSLSLERGGGSCPGCRLELSVAAWRARCECGYLLAGVTAAICPECGRRAITPAPEIPREKLASETQ